jgi:hypothetical protein
MTGVIRYTLTLHPLPSCEGRGKLRKGIAAGSRSCGQDAGYMMQDEEEIAAVAILKQAQDRRSLAMTVIFAAGSRSYKILER